MAVTSARWRAGTVPVTLWGGSCVPVPLWVSPDRTLRLKIIDACGMACTFCHNEGTPVASDNLPEGSAPFRSGPGRTGRVSIYLESNGARFLPAMVRPDAELRLAIETMRDCLDLDEVHLTGGEPTLHPQLSGLIEMVKDLGCTVSMTSNGENGERTLPECHRAGLDRVNFSVFATRPDELAEVQHRRYRSLARADRKVAALQRSVSVAASLGMKASANIVVPSYEHSARVLRLLDEFSASLSVRMLNSLHEGQKSIDAIRHVLADLNAIPVMRHVVAGASGARTDYRLSDGRIVHFKELRRVRLPNTCADCRFNSDRDCEEGYYGVRLYRARGGGYVVGVCIQRMDLCRSLSDFVDSDLSREILDFRAAECRRLAGS